MASTTHPDFLAEKRREFEQRLQEIKPEAEKLTHEVQAIERTLEAWSNIDQGHTATTTPRRRRQASTGTTQRRRGRPSGSGEVPQKVIDALRKHGPMKITEIAQSIDTHANYLYRVMPRLEEEGKVTRQESGEFTVATQTPSNDGPNGNES